jgi:hypothetical protein
MSLSFRATMVILAMTTGSAIAEPQTAAPQAGPPQSPPPQAARAPVPAGPLLGTGHVWLKFGQLDLDHSASSAWGVHSEDYLAIEGYHGNKSNLYFGGEFGRSAASTAVNADGDTIQDFDFSWLEMNEKMAVDLTRGFTFDFGAGAALFYVDGEEVLTSDGVTYTDPLADLGFGAQLLIDFNWRLRHLLLGVDAKYQWAFDVISVDYSNFRYGAHIGVAF